MANLIATSVPIIPIAPSITLLSNTANGGALVTTTPSGDPKQLIPGDGLIGVGYNGSLEEDSISIILEEV